MCGSELDTCMMPSAVALGDESLYPVQQPLGITENTKIDLGLLWKTLCVQWSQYGEILRSEGAHV